MDVDVDAVLVRGLGGLLGEPSVEGAVAGAEAIASPGTVLDAGVESTS
jgi:hypothetical protein